MNWQVTSTISGGHAHSAATLEEYSGCAAALNDAARQWSTLAATWNTTMMQVGGLRMSAPLCPALQSGNVAAAGHVTLPFQRIVDDCGDHIRQCRLFADELTEMAELLIRAYSLYSEAERTTQRVVTELIQVGAALFPGHAAAATAAIAVGGFIGGSLAEGGTNGIHALDATAWAQEGLMSGLASKVAGIGGLKGALSTDEVNRAAGGIASVTAPLYGALQGDALQVKQVYSRTEVVRESHSVAEAMENLRRLGEERLGKIDLNSGLEYGTIAIQEYRKADGSSSWLVTIPGTDGKLDSPFGWPQNVELMSSDPEQRMHADSARMVLEAMERAGIGKDEPVALIGHSQGGIVAAAIASDMADQYTFEHVVTCGSPVANHPIPERTWVTSVEIDDELVAALDGAANPATENWLTISGTVHKAPGSLTTSVSEEGYCVPGIGPGAEDPFTAASVRDTGEDKEITHWLKYHQAAYQNATDLGSPAVQRHEAHFQEVLDGELVSTTYWQGRMTASATMAPGEPVNPPRL